MIFHQALEVDPEERDRYVIEECSGDDQLVLEVNSLLRALHENQDFMDQPVLDLGLEILADCSDNSLVGKTVGPYRIEKKLGEGGMGDVYLAEDTRLSREVALKFLSAPFLHDNWARRQLVREARAVAMLDHQNICPVFGIEEIGEHHFIVMQYVKGETLSHLIHSRSIDSDEALSLARQIVDAIATAHAHGIIHRDIKPGNIMLTAEGQVKVLDFGLAKIIHQKNKSEAGGQDLSQASQTGLVQGTVAYMSPEQLKAEKLDYRTDIFSLGTVLYELVTGGNPFASKSDAETISAILRPDSPFDGSTSGKIPVGLRHIIGKCLRKEKDQRYQSASELLFDLQDPVRAQRRGKGFFYLRILALVLIISMIVAIFFLYFRSEHVYKTAVLPFTNETADSSLDYLSDGIAESLIAKLSGSSKLQLKPYTLVNGFRGSDVDNLKVGRDVQADLVLTGKISLQNDQLMLRTNLLDTVRGISIRNWENKFRLSDIPSLENEIADGFLSSLAIQENLQDGSRSGSMTNNGEAFRQYLVGRHYWRRRDPQNLQTAIAAFQRSIDLDPGYSRPYAGLADSYVLLTSVAYGPMRTKEAMAKARAAAKQALEIDPNSAEAHTSLGVVLTKHDWNWLESEREFRRAIELDSDYAAAHFWLSSLLGILGRADESITEAERARDLDPFSPLVDLNLARNYYFARQYDKAIEVLSKQNEPTLHIKYMMGLAYLQKGMYDQAIKIFEEVSRDNKTLGAAALGYTYAKTERRSDATRLIAELERASKDSDAMSQEIAIIYVGLNEKDKAFQYLNQAFQDRHGALIALKVEPLFDTLRNDERFLHLLRQMSLN